MIKAAVLGYGTVGSGVVEVLDKNKERVAKRELQHALIVMSMGLLQQPRFMYFGNSRSSFLHMLTNHQTPVGPDVWFPLFCSVLSWFFSS